MNADVSEKAEALSAAHVLEAAQMRLPELLGIDDPASAAVRVCELAGLSSTDMTTLITDAQQAATESQTAITSLLRSILAAVAEEESDHGETERAMGAVGRKEMVIGPEVYYLGALLISGFIAWWTRGRSHTEETVTVEKGKDGRVVVKISKKVTYLDPLNPLTNLISRIRNK